MSIFKIIPTLLCLFYVESKEESLSHVYCLLENKDFTVLIFRWIKDIKRNEKQVYSQNGEDGALEYIFQNIGTSNKIYVEFGTEDAQECNTRYLRYCYIRNIFVYLSSSRTIPPFWVIWTQLILFSGKRAGTSKSRSWWMEVTRIWRSIWGRSCSGRTTSSTCFPGQRWNIL